MQLGRFDSCPTHSNAEFGTRNAELNSFRIPRSAIAGVRWSIGRTPRSQRGRRGSTPRRTTRRAPPTARPPGDVAQLAEATVSEAVRCGFDSHRHHFWMSAGYANWHSGQVEGLMFVGSTPTLVTAEWTGVGCQHGL